MRLLLRKAGANESLQLSEDCTKGEIIEIAIAWGASYWLLIDDGRLIDDGSIPE